MYGTTSAPYHAMRCLRELAALYRDELPLAARAMEKNFFMDDRHSGRRTFQAAIELQKQHWPSHWPSNERAIPSQEEEV